MGVYTRGRGRCNVNRAGQRGSLNGHRHGPRTVHTGCSTAGGTKPEGTLFQLSTLLGVQRDQQCASWLSSADGAQMVDAADKKREHKNLQGKKLAKLGMPTAVLSTSRPPASCPSCTHCW